MYYCADDCEHADTTLPNVVVCKKFKKVLQKSNSGLRCKRCDQCVKENEVEEKKEN